MTQPLTEEEVKLLFKSLKKIQFFASIPVKSIDRIIDQFFKVQAGRGKKIIGQGRPGTALYVIKSGSCLVYRRTGLFFRKKIAALGEGEFFGEMSLLYDAPTSASVLTLERSELFVILRNDFLRVLEDSPDTLRQIRAIAEDRRSANARDSVRDSSR